MLQVRLGRDLEQRLGRLAKKRGRRKDFYVRQAVEEYVENAELYDIAVKAWEEHEKSGIPASPAEEVWKRLGLGAENN